MSTFVPCSRCGKQVSNDTGVDIVVRAFVECPECIERTPETVELAATDSQQPQLEMPCESDFMAWCAIQHYNQSEAASIYRYIARHIKRVR